MIQTLRRRLALLLAVGMLTGCIAAPAKENPTPATEEDPATQQMTAQEAPETEEVADEATWPRTVTDVGGNEVTFEKKPERISLLHTYPLEYLLALGESSALSDSELYGPYLDELNPTDLGSAMEINKEAVLASQPDLLLTFAGHKGMEAAQESLAQIAPMLFMDYTASWQEQLTFCANIFGKEAEVEALVAEIEASVEETKQAVKAHPDRLFALFRTDGKNFIGLGQAAYYDEFGLKKPAEFTERSVTMSLEAVAEMNPYYIVFQHNRAATDAFLETMESSSVWQSMEAVKEGRVIRFDEDMNTFGPLTMRLAAQKLKDLYLK